MKRLIIFLWIFSNYCFSQKATIFKIDSIPKQGILLDKGWKWHAGDNPDFSKVDFDDSKWESIDPTKAVPELLKQISIDKPLWLRLKFSTEINKAVALSIIQSGASEIFLNEKKILSFGQIDHKNKTAIAYDPQNDASVLKLDTNINTLAIRYHFQKKVRYNSVFSINFPLFKAQLNNHIHQSNVGKYVWNGFNIGFPFILFIVHLIYFISYTRNKTNLWYSLSSFFCFIGAFLLLQLDLTHSIEFKNHLTNYVGIVGTLQNTFLYITIFLFLKQKNNWLVIVFISIAVVALLLNYFDFIQSSVLINYFITLFYVSSVIYMGYQAWKQGMAGGKYLIFAMICYIIFWTLFIISYSSNWGNLANDVLFHIATLILPIIISVLLGVDFRNTNNSLLENLKEVNKLSIEKQQILATQNETLERQVNERTAELKASQAQLIQKEKLASLGELTAGIAHEIQNPLNFVNNFSEVSSELVNEMKEELAVGNQQSANEIADDLKQNLEKITHHGKRASSIVKGMLEHSKASSGEKELTDINALGDEYLRLSYYGLRAKNKDFNSDFKTDFDPNLPKIKVIPQDIGRVLLNLINNAFYATHESKKPEPMVMVTTKLIPSLEGSDRRTVRLDGAAGGWVSITVKDNGNGMSEATKAKIFQPFFTTKPTGQGTGLGLSLAYDIVTKGHGGTIEVKSEEGVGTIFIIQLPKQDK